MRMNIVPAMKVVKNDGDNSKTEYIAFTDSIRVIKKDGETIEGIFIRLNIDKVVIAVVDKTINVEVLDIESIDVIS